MDSASGGAAQVSWQQMRALRPHVRVALAVPGQGSQAVGMGKALHAAYPAARAVFDRVEASLRLPLTRVMFEGPKAELTRTAYTQPAILTHAVAAFEALKVRQDSTSSLTVPGRTEGAERAEHRQGSSRPLCRRDCCPVHRRRN